MLVDRVAVEHRHKLIPERRIEYLTWNPSPMTQFLLATVLTIAFAGLMVLGTRRVARYMTITCATHQQGPQSVPPPMASNAGRLRPTFAEDTPHV